jgi:hypothetical protein
MSNPLLIAAAEYARLKNDGLELFRAMPTQMPVFNSTATEILARGGNRSGKSTCLAVRFASIARDKPIIGSDGKPIDLRLPWQKNRSLMMWVVGLQWDHIGSTIFRLLFKRGLYKIIRDEHTGAWRAFDPVGDNLRERDARPSFPLIPMSEIKGGFPGIAWENKKERQFSSLELNNGTIIKAWASTGEVKQGDPVDEIWIDERIAFPAHYPEWQARLSDTKGRISWSSMPREDNGAMMKLSRLAQSQAEEVQSTNRDHADVEEVVLTFSGNPFIDDDEKRKRLEGWSDEDRRRRDAGEFVTDSIRIYPRFDKTIHCAIYDNKDDDDQVSTILRERGGVPPQDWTHELILDPGTTRPAVLFAAVPPPSLWDGREPYYVLYDEIYVPRIDARQLAQLIRKKKDELKLPAFERFIIDGQAARQTPMGFAGTIGQHYTDEFKKANVFCRQSNCSFIPGDPSFLSRSGIVGSWMSYRASGKPQLRIVINRCPALVRQLQYNVRKTELDHEGYMLVLDKPADNQRDDVLACLEYWASRRPTWVEADISSEIAGPMFAHVAKIEQMFNKRKEPKDSGVVHCGPGRAA